jgi:hypothetical protein
MKINQVKILSIALFTFVLLLFLGFQNKFVGVKADGDVKAIYMQNCKMCHLATATKNFDANKADDVLKQVILDGKDAKPMKMPAYTAKPEIANKAAELVTFMKDENKKASTPSNTNTQ